MTTIQQSHERPPKLNCRLSCPANVSWQFIANYGTLFMGGFSRTTFFCKSTSVVSWAQFLLGQSAADTKLLPKLKPVQLYGTIRLHRTAVSWQTQDAGKFVSKINQHDDTCGLSFIFRGSRHSFSTCFELSGSSSSGVHFSCTVSHWYSV